MCTESSEGAPRLIDLLPPTIEFEGGSLLRMGGGEFVDKYPYLSILYIRQAFLELLADEAYDVIEDLYTQVLPNYREPIDIDAMSEDGIARDIDDQGDPYPWFPLVIEWMRRWFHVSMFDDTDHMRKYRDATWLLLAACDSLRTRQDVYEGSGEDAIRNGGRLHVSDGSWMDSLLNSDAVHAELYKQRNPEPLRAAASTWNPWAESRNRAEDRILKELGEHVRRQMDAIEERLVKRGHGGPPSNPRPETTCSGSSATR